VFIFSILLAVLLWCSRMYRSLRHNAALNRHRADALNTLDAVGAAAGDAETKSAVLVQATSSIFTPQATGYLGGDGDPVPGSQIIELWRSMASRGGPTPT